MVALFLFLKGMTVALAPLSYLVSYNITPKCSIIVYLWNLLKMTDLNFLSDKEAIFNLLWSMKESN